MDEPEAASIVYEPSASLESRLNLDSSSAQTRLPVCSILSITSFLVLRQTLFLDMCMIRSFSHWCRRTYNTHIGGPFYTHGQVLYGSRPFDEFGQKGQCPSSHLDFCLHVWGFMVPFLSGPLPYCALSMHHYCTADVPLQYCSGSHARLWSTTTCSQSHHTREVQMRTWATKLLLVLFPYLFQLKSNQEEQNQNR